MNCRSISIVFHETTTRDQMRMYRVSNYARNWHEAGIEVRLLSGADHTVEADLVIPQIDLTVMPESYRRLLNLDTRVVNRRVVDISKSSFSRHLLSQGDDYAGPVIVKTNANYGGQPEAKLLSLMARTGSASNGQSGARTRAPDAETGTHPAKITTLNSSDYPIFRSLANVPDAVHGNPALIIEKFLPEYDGQYFYLRSYAFFGSRGLAVRTRSNRPVVKGSNATGLEFIPVHEDIRQARDELGFDSGKFDYVLHKGRAILLDINDTPTFGNSYSTSERNRICHELAGGLSAWFNA